MPNPELPVGIDEGYLPVWEEFNRMKAVTQLRGLTSEPCVSECFRLLVQQTGARVKSRMKTDDFVEFKSGMKRIRAWMHKYGLHRSLKATKTDVKVTLVEAPIVCAVLNPTITGVVHLKCVPFGIKYALTMLDNRAWRTRPMQLADTDYLGRPRKFLPVSKLKPKDFYCVFEDEGLEFGIARTESELIFQFRYVGAKAVPHYQSLERDLKRLKYSAITGVFK